VLLVRTPRLFAMAESESLPTGGGAAGSAKQVRFMTRRVSADSVVSLTEAIGQCLAEAYISHAAASAVNDVVKELLDLHIVALEGMTECLRRQSLTSLQQALERVCVPERSDIM
jgi:hypothetical protein